MAVGFTVISYQLSARRVCGGKTLFYATCLDD